VLLIELEGGLSGEALDLAAGGLADVIRLEARSTDRAVRVGAASFRMLLPETSLRSARHVVGRLERAFNAAPDPRHDSAHLWIEVVAPTRGGSLEDALIDAEHRLGR
jgi:GGDEF domain-containing protein